MINRGLLSPDRVRELREKLGYDLKVEEAAVWKEKMSSGKNSRTSAGAVEPVASASAAAARSGNMNQTEPPTVLPPVGRHTQALERKSPMGQGSETRIRKPSLPEVPELKKPKLEAKDVVMQENVVEPGAPIESQSTDDADIPCSPHFAAKDSSVPHFDLTLEDDGAGVPKTQNDDAADKDDDEPLIELDGEGDELAKAAVAARVHANQHALIHNSGELFQNSGGAPIPNPAGIAKWAFGDAPSGPQHNCPPPVSSSLPAPDLPMPNPNYSGALEPPDIMPPWVREIRDGFYGLHQKADQIHQQMTMYGAEMQAHSVRLSNLEQVSSEHTGKHANHDARIKALESKIESLLAQLDNPVIRSRSPSRTGLGTGNRSPSPRSPRNGFRSPRAFGKSDGFGLGDTEDLDIVVGGWSDARKTDAFDEVRNIFESLQQGDCIDEIWAPYGRTSFAKVKIIFPDPEAHISVRRKFQTQLVNSIRNKNFRSGVVGSEGAKIWATKSKTPEERAKIRAVVLTKEFYKSVPSGEGLACFSDEQIEISWAGKVFIDRFQLLGSVERDGEPKPYDVCIEDSRGNHMNWYLKADVFQQVSGRPKETLQDLWLEKGPTSSVVRAEA